MQFAFLNSNKYAAINALKATVAVAIAYTLGLLLGNFFNIEQMYLWMTITVVVVMSTQPNLGGALDKALMRFLGTVAGAMVALVIIAVVQNHILQVLLILPFICLAVYFAGASKYSYAGTLAGITIIIIILNKQPGVQVAIYRAIEISLGIAISLFVNRFIFPIRAETRLKESYVKTISEIHDFFDILFIERNHSHKKLRTSIFHEFAKHLTLIKELKYEKSAKKVQEFEKMSLYIRRLYRYMIVMYEYIEFSFDPETIADLDKEPAFVEFKKYIMKSLTDVSEDIKKRKRISYKELLRFERHILPLLKDVRVLNDKDESFIFYIKMFLNALKRLSLEHNYILQISKH
ncbi:FUSC family protein [Francisella philomiragia]|uniref:FUSC family protein n=1 Tax=Francisella philomiragia TaxID=28110 RepID=UPI001903DD4A|nr:FUSC family protein [Francisella philomiragia]MBK2267892.1 FUSC family protein [Francisella philomiragia]MBK2279397.1 FUSC family protein [Francisella philomiragia]MBK2287251.1 FUSC family protein [Francisella philomiragia]MBK2289229.1 FUSC family protein [Francisella philomiragia]MBK2290947.1 FUSC family protein [Francisella philomiragia]